MSRFNESKRLPSGRSNPQPPAADALIARQIGNGADLVITKNRQRTAHIGALVRSHDAVLVKGSRGVRMERVVEALMAAHPGAAA
ncbi:MAG TPA: hypothetical protein PKU70_08710, partial [Vicinamibacteria bacterium]|nr:hypothetical protein [Vicinamibacteria bacterium]